MDFKAEAQGLGKKVFSRRRFLTAAAGIAVAGHAIGADAALENLINPPVKTKPREAFTAKPAQPSSSPAVPTTTPAPVPTALPVVSKSETPARAENKMDLSPLFSFCDGDAEKNEAARLAEEQLQELKNMPGVEKIISKTKSWVPMVRQVCGKFKAVHPQLVSILPGLIFTESNGDQYAQSTKKAVPKKGVDLEPVASGLMQLKDQTALDEYNKLPSDIKSQVKTILISGEKKVDLFDGQSNLIVGAAHLNSLLDVYVDPAVAVWVYHLGQGYMNEVILDFMRVGIKLPEQDLDKYKVGEGYRFPNLIKDHNLTFMKLYSWFSKSYERLGFKKNRLDNTQIYTPRVEAAISLLI